MVMQFTSCCCGCSLKTGTITIGHLSGLLAFCGLVRVILVFAPANADPETGVEFTESEQAVFICMAVAYTIQSFASILLLQGAYSERPRLIKIWIIITVIILIIHVMFTLAQSKYLFDKFFVYGITILIILAFLVTIFTYFILVVNSFYNKLRQEYKYETFYEPTAVYNTQSTVHVL